MEKNKQTPNGSQMAEETEFVKDLGFDGKSVIHPRQIPIIHNVFKPKKEEFDFAKRVIAKMKESKQKGIGVFALDGQMIDEPVVRRAERLVALAKMY